MLPEHKNNFRMFIVDIYANQRGNSATIDYAFFEARNNRNTRRDQTHNIFERHFNPIIGQVRLSLITIE
jgi:hypothetical protein